MKSTREGNGYLWEESSTTERLPVEPDAMFSLRLSDRWQDAQLAHFFMIADCGTMNATDMLRKLRAYFHFVKRQQLHQESFGIHPVPGQHAILDRKMTQNEDNKSKVIELCGEPSLSPRSDGQRRLPENDLKPVAGELRRIAQERAARGFVPDPAVRSRVIPAPERIREAYGDRPLTIAQLSDFDRTLIFGGTRDPDSKFARCVLPGKRVAFAGQLLVS